jgi:RNA polymerase sigma-70 factor (ECF subfamily)
VSPAQKDLPPRDAVAPAHEATLRELYAEHGPALLNYLMRITRGDRHLAEDVVQETMVRAWRHPEAQRADGSWSRPWLFTVAYRIAIDQIRAGSARPAELLDEHIDLHAYANDEVDRLLDAREIRAAIVGLPERLRTILIEVYFRDHSVAEAAEALRIPPGTVKSRTFYALRALHDSLVRSGFLPDTSAQH